MTERYDVVIIGGGPAGAGASYELADAGAKVLVIEKAKYPRPKLCAGCISKRSVDLFPAFNLKNRHKRRDTGLQRPRVCRKSFR